jgi:hypothetical protein
MRIKISTLFIILMASFTLGFVPVQAHAEQCLSQFPDSAWTHGAPIQQYQLGNDLVLYAATVTTAPGQNLKGVVIPWMGTAREDRYFLRTGQTVLATSTNPVSQSQMLDAAAGQDFDNYLNLSAYNVIPENSITQVPITVSWEYRGATCGTRSITVHSYLDVKPALTINIQDPGITSAGIPESLFKSLGVINFLDKQKVYEYWLKTANEYAATKANPLPLIGATEGDWDNYFFSHTSETSVSGIGFWTSLDGCVVSTENDAVFFSPRDSKISSGNSICKVTAHWFNRLNPTAQVVANLWLKAAPGPSSTKGRVSVTITCIKGKVTKKIARVKPVCPVGYKKK